MTSVAMAFGKYLSLEVATTGNWYSMKHVLKTETKKKFKSMSLKYKKSTDPTSKTLAK